MKLWMGANLEVICMYVCDKMILKSKIKFSFQGSMSDGLQNVMHQAWNPLSGNWQTYYQFLLSLAIVHTWWTFCRPRAHAVINFYEVIVEDFETMWLTLLKCCFWYVIHRRCTIPAMRYVLDRSIYRSPVEFLCTLSIRLCEILSTCPTRNSG